jgi:CheY-like chemotaxis protein
VHSRIRLPAGFGCRDALSIRRSNSTHCRSTVDLEKPITVANGRLHVLSLARRVYALQILRRKAIDVVLLDFDLGEGDGRKFLRLAKDQGFRGKVLVVTAGVDAGVAAELIRSGISGVFRKHDSAALLAQAIRDVMAGKVWLDQEQLQSVLRTEVGAPQDNTSATFLQVWCTYAQSIGTYRLRTTSGSNLARKLRRLPDDQQGGNNRGSWVFFPARARESMGYCGRCGVSGDSKAKKHIVQ